MLSDSMQFGPENSLERRVVSNVSFVLGKFIE